MSKNFKAGDSLRLKKSIDIGVPDQPEKGDVGVLKKKLGPMCHIEFEGKAKYPSTDGQWKARNHDVEKVCPHCHRPVCLTMEV